MLSIYYIPKLWTRACDTAETACLASVWALKGRRAVCRQSSPSFPSMTRGYLPVKMAGRNARIPLFPSALVRRDCWGTWEGSSIVVITRAGAGDISCGVRSGGKSKLLLWGARDVESRVRAALSQDSLESGRSMRKITWEEAKVSYRGRDGKSLLFQSPAQEWSEKLVSLLATLPCRGRKFSTLKEWKNAMSSLDKQSCRSTKGCFELTVFICSRLHLEVPSFVGDLPCAVRDKPLATEEQTAAGRHHGASAMPHCPCQDQV